MSTEVALAPPFDALRLAKSLLRHGGVATLATQAEGGFPFASLTAIASDFDGSPLCLFSQLAHHTRQLQNNPKAALLIASSGKGDPLNHPRLSLTGTMQRIASEDPARMRARSRFLARNPKAKLYADFGDFSFWRLQIEKSALNGGFGKAADLQAQALLSPTFPQLAEIEAGFLAKWQNKLEAQTIRWPADPPGEGEIEVLKIFALDSEGVDFTSYRGLHRHWFEAPALNAKSLRQQLERDDVTWNHLASQSPSQAKT